MKPIVASRIPSLTCMLSENEAYFFTPDNPSSLRDTLVHALSGKESEKKAQAAYKKGRQFTWSRRAELILNSMKQ
jgi:glycosyltransferase involved in cell wall biosynthesis